MALLHPLVSPFHVSRYIGVDGMTASLHSLSATMMQRGIGTILTIHLDLLGARHYGAQVGRLDHSRCPDLRMPYLSKS